MPQLVTAEDARATRRRASSNGTWFWLTSYIGANRYTATPVEPPGPDGVYPMAFMVEQDAGAVVGPHYHQADQFQVVIGGAGRLGRHDVSAGAVHFAGAWSAYGPLAAGEAGLQYFTLRNGWDSGARYMEYADDRAALRRRPVAHRELVGTDVSADGGLFARRHSLAEGERIIGADPAEGGGQFWLVLSGGMVHDGQDLRTASCAFVHPAEPPFTAEAGLGGAEVLAMQFPRRTVYPPSSADGHPPDASRAPPRSASIRSK